MTFLFIIMLILGLFYLAGTLLSIGLALIIFLFLAIFSIVNVYKKKTFLRKLNKKINDLPEKLKNKILNINNYSYNAKLLNSTDKFPKGLYSIEFDLDNIYLIPFINLENKTSITKDEYINFINIIENLKVYSFPISDISYYESVENMLKNEYKDANNNIYFKNETSVYLYYKDGNIPKFLQFDKSAIPIFNMLIPEKDKMFFREDKTLMFRLDILNELLEDSKITKEEYDNKRKKYFRQIIKSQDKILTFIY